MAAHCSGAEVPGARVQWGSNMGPVAIQNPQAVLRPTQLDAIVAVSVSWTV